MIITKLLIANRGEIASRVISSAQDMGISCVAIYIGLRMTGVVHEMSRGNSCLAQ